MSYYSGYDDDWRPYIPVAERRRQAARKIAALKKSGRKISPIEIAGRKITTTFWGDAWSRNLESYSDYANRLPRGRTYVRNGSLIDLQIEAGRARALVSGSEIYRVDIAIKRLAKAHWSDIKGQCAGQIGSLVELLQGSLSKGVMEIVTRKDAGLFPAPREISLDCSCPDWATMCKHVAATLYGVGARLDHEPQLLFTLRGVDPTEMLEAAIDRPVTGSRSPRGRVLETDALSSVFGIDLVDDRDVAVRPEKAGSAGRSGKGGGKVRGKTEASKTQTRSGEGKSSRRKSAAKRSATKVSAGKAAAKKKAGVKKGAKTKAGAKKAASKKTGAKKRASKKAAVKKRASKKGRVRKTASKKRASSKASGGK